MKPGDVMIRIESTCEATTPQISARVINIAQQFGIPPFFSRNQVLDALNLVFQPGRIVLFSGPSGSGKSTALRLIAAQLPGGHAVDRIHLASGRAVVDAIAPGESLPKALEILAACGLSEAPLWLRSPDDLSDGQHFRARLARAVSLHARTRSGVPLICDEFCSGLHRRLAHAIAYNLRKLATRHRLTLVLAACDDDFLDDLQPDVLVRLRGNGRHECHYLTPMNRSISFRDRLAIEPGLKADYESFASMHYRTTDELGFVDKVFILRDTRAGDLLGIVVYSHGPLELSLRNVATDNRFRRNPGRLNREVRILRRLVIHPDVRGCGLGHYLVEKTMPLVGARFIECLAGMGETNPVFERAGMKRIGTCPMPPGRAALLDEFNRLGVDPFARDFVLQVARRPRVRRIVAALVYQWYQATTAGGERRVARQSPEFLANTFRGLVGSRPVYFLWENPRFRRNRRTKAVADDRPKKPRARSLRSAKDPGAVPRGGAAKRARGIRRETPSRKKIPATPGDGPARVK